VFVDGNYRAQAGDAEKIGEFLVGGGTLMMTAAFSQFFAMGEGTPWKDIKWTGGFRGSWSRQAAGDSFLGVVTQDSTLLPEGMKKGTTLPWWGIEMDRFWYDNADEKDILIGVESTNKQYTVKNQAAFFIHPVGKGKLIGVSMSTAPEMVPLLRNIVVDAMQK